MKIKLIYLIGLLVLIVIAVGVIVIVSTNNKNNTTEIEGSEISEISNNTGSNKNNDNEVEVEEIVEEDYRLEKLSYKIPSNYVKKEDADGKIHYNYFSEDDFCSYGVVLKSIKYEVGTEEDVLQKIEADNFGVDIDKVAFSSGLQKEKINNFEWNVEKIKLKTSESGVTVYGEFYYGFKGDKLYVLAFTAAKSDEIANLSVYEMRPIIDSLNFN